MYPFTVISTGSHTTVSNYCNWYCNREAQVVTRLVVLLSSCSAQFSSIGWTYTAGGVDTSMQGVDAVMPGTPGVRQVAGP